MLVIQKQSKKQTLYLTKKEGNGAPPHDFFVCFFIFSFLPPYCSLPLPLFIFFLQRKKKEGKKIIGFFCFNTVC